jgi:hypothetical protein
MTRLASATIVLAALLAVGTGSVPAHAQISRTWVSGTGDDAQQCTRTLPCKTFAGALSKTNAGGEINCLDPAGYGQVTITKSITIDCNGTIGSVLASSGNGITINLDGQANMIVRLRNISINGLLTAAIGISITGTSSTAANNAVSIEDCVIDGFLTNGINDSLSVTPGPVSARLLVKNTIIRNGPASGLAIAGFNGGASQVKAILDNVSVFDWNQGFAAGNGAQVLIKNSISASNVLAGVVADNGSFIAVSSSTILGNGTGIIAGSSATVRIGNTDIAFNTTGISGTVQTFVDNRITSNGAGGTLSPVSGSVTNPQGWQ